MEDVIRSNTLELIIIVTEGTVDILMHESSVYKNCQFNLCVSRSLNKAVILLFLARVTTSISTAVAIVTSFVDSQFTFCSMQKSRPPKKSLHEQVSDIEYILPRVR
jgi:hypothetical protein